MQKQRRWRGKVLLDQILAVKRKEAEALREKSRMWKKEIEIRRGPVTPAQVKELRSLKEAILHSTNRIGLIAEVKKASPSKADPSGLRCGGDRL
ncbi:hypothetical protein CULT_720019 [[Clostridium] ultunense Esp]|nr:hypothetical protein CULT_720019 [[Clostridium] ultunense Esp]